MKFICSIYSSFLAKVVVDREINNGLLLNKNGPNIEVKNINRPP